MGLIPNGLGFNEEGCLHVSGGSAKLWSPKEQKKQLCHKAVFKTEKNIAGTKPGQKYVQACRDEKEKLPSFGASSSLV